MLSSDSRCGSTARLSSLCRWLLPALLASLAPQAPAQTAAAPEVAPSERAKRDAEKVFQWIRLHADKPRKSAPPAAAPDRPAATTPTAARVLARPAAKPADSGITETVTPLNVPAQTALAPAKTTPAPAAAELPKAEPAVVAATQPRTPAPVEEQDMPLRPVRQAEPEFPPSLMRQLRRGLVQVSFTVQPDGSVANPKAVSSTHPRLAQTAVATVAQWKFEPVRHAQQGVVDLGFNLD